jgi:hypothetical protein
MRKWLAVLMVLGLVAGCAHHRRVSDEYSGNLDSTVHIENHHWGDVDVFLLHDGQRTRLGMVTATTDQTFMIKSRLVGSASQMQLEAHAIGMSGVLDSELMAYRPGMQINWTLESNLSRATLSIF